jgi:putative PIN family toxin of toxin-antitoxin system
MLKRKIKVILDTNWYISATINRKSRRSFYKLLIDKRLQIIYADELLVEYQLVMNRKKFLKIILPAQIQRFIYLILPKLLRVVIKTSVQISRDIKDDYLLALAIDSQAKYLVTGDNDLLVLGKVVK